MKLKHTAKKYEKVYIIYEKIKIDTELIPKVESLKEDKELLNSVCNKF
jgi:hypothetical protein